MSSNPTERFEHLALSAVQPSTTNPRTHFDAHHLDELAQSIREKGVVQPILVRPVNGHFEIVAGECRFRASKLAQLADIPAVVREYSDEQVLELQLIENVQRHDLHPLEEADGYARLMKLDPAYTPKAIAAKIGKSDRYVQQRLQLARLEPDIKKAFLADQITAGHADLLSRLQPADQKAGLKSCFEHLYGEDKDHGCISVRDLKRWIDENVRLSLTKDDPQTAYFPELNEVVEDASKVIQVSTTYDQTLKGMLSHTAWRAVEGKRCPHAQRAVIVLGDQRGKLIDVCTATTLCTKHWAWEVGEAKRRAAAPSEKSGGGSAAASTARKAQQADKARRDRDAAQRARWESAKRRAIDQLRQKALAPTPALLGVLARLTGNGPKVKTWPDLVANLLDDNLFVYSPRDFKEAAATLKLLGIDLAGIDKTLQKEQAATKAQTSAKAKKPAKTAKAKAAA